MRTYPWCLTVVLTRRVLFLVCASVSLLRASAACSSRCLVARPCAILRFLAVSVMMVVALRRRPG